MIDPNIIMIHNIEKQCDELLKSDSVDVFLFVIERLLPYLLVLLIIGKLFLFFTFIKIISSLFGS